MNFAVVILKGIFNGTGNSVGNSTKINGGTILFAIVIISSGMKCIIVYL
jgi:hypothetical protein